MEVCLQSFLLHCSKQVHVGSALKATYGCMDKDICYILLKWMISLVTFYAFLTVNKCQKQQWTNILSQLHIYILTNSE